MSLPDHTRQVLAREYWRCTGLRENARLERISYAATADEFRAQEVKWAERAESFLQLLGGEIPDNPLPGTIEDQLMWGDPE